MSPREKQLEDALRSILYPKPGVSVTWEAVGEMKKLLFPENKPLQHVPLRTVTTDDLPMMQIDKLRDDMLKCLAVFQDAVAISLGATVSLSKDEWDVLWMIANHGMTLFPMGGGGPARELYNRGYFTISGRGRVVELTSKGREALKQYVRNM